MKILWLVNLIMPELAEQLGEKPTVFGGWLVGAMNAVRASENELVVCAVREDCAENTIYDVNGVRYYISSKSAPDFAAIIEKENPDVVHIYGTEFKHAMQMSEVAEKGKTVVTIQGPLTQYIDHVFAGLPDELCCDNEYHRLLRSIHKGGESIELQRMRFIEYAEYEKKALNNAAYINGGSKWGDACGKLINPEAETLECNLILRDSFYTDERWSAERCERHSVYAAIRYPIKGFHCLLEAVKLVAEKYPDTKIYAVGGHFTYREYTGLKRCVMDKAPDYNWYIQNKIDEYGLRDNIVFTGLLSEKEVKECLLNSNVFVTASSIENQCTALGEAMILGVPSISSCVGAAQEMIDHGEDGFLYPFNETYMLAYYICRIFEDDELAKQFSVKGHEHAAKTYDRKTNCRKLLEMYETINKNAKENEP